MTKLFVIFLAVSGVQSAYAACMATNPICVKVRVSLPSRELKVSSEPRDCGMQFVTNEIVNTTPKADDVTVKVGKRVEVMISGKTCRTVMLDQPIYGFLGHTCDDTGMGLPGYYFSPARTDGLKGDVAFKYSPSCTRANFGIDFRILKQIPEPEKFFRECAVDYEFKDAERTFEVELTFDSKKIRSATLVPAVEGMPGATSLPVPKTLVECVTRKLTGFDLKVG